MRAGVIVLVAFLAACRGRPPAEVAPVIVEADRFPHDRHGDIGCVDCHDAASVAAGIVALPGARDHAPCDQGKCHQEAFESEPGPVCKICHVSVDVTGASPPSMVEYPRTGGWRVMPARFSHKAHLDADAMEKAVGFHVSCADCHTQGDTDAPGIGGHAECARCHAAEVGLARAPTMAQCTGCHDPQAKEERHRRRVITGDLHFDHRNHATDTSGATIRCQTCHPDTTRARARDDLAKPPIAACVACHDDSTKVPGTMSMRACGACHATVEESIGRLAPRSHLPGSERPVDHTLAFRTDHGEDAARDTKRCAGCHTQMSGSADAACDECHQVMRPHDHNVVFRELDHGTSASTDPERCATCHVVDYCVACHRQKPSSHFGNFSSNHGLLARENVRSCLTCHGPGDDIGPACTDCHIGGP